MRSRYRRRFLRFSKHGNAEDIHKALLEYCSSPSDLFYLTDRRDRTMLHLACKYGRSRVVDLLLNMQFPANSIDKLGNTALTYLLLAILKSRKSRLIRLAIDRLLPVSKSSLDVMNVNGDSPTVLLRRIFEGIEKTGNINAARESVPYDDAVQCGEEEHDDVEWNQRLAEEEDECSSAIGGYYNSDAWADDLHETFDQWSCRISQEYREKNFPRSRGKSEEKCESHRAAESPRRSASELVKIHERAAAAAFLRARKLLFDSLFEECSGEHFPGVPFIDFDWTEGDVAEFLLEGVQDEDKREYLRRQQVFWHPDKFFQRFGSKITAAQLDRVTSYVNAMSKTVNSILSALS